MLYKVIKVRDLHDSGPIGQFEAILNEEAQDGWKLHSLVPQIDNGGTFNNVAIFTKEIGND
jgi:Domain of unknown function (DUF4177)